MRYVVFPVRYLRQPLRSRAAVAQEQDVLRLGVQRANVGVVVRGLGEVDEILLFTAVFGDANGLVRNAVERIPDRFPLRRLATVLEGVAEDHFGHPMAESLPLLARHDFEVLRQLLDQPAALDLQHPHLSANARSEFEEGCAPTGRISTLGLARRGADASFDRGTLAPFS